MKCIMTMVSEDLPRYYRIKKNLRSDLNGDMELTKTPGESEGVSTPFRSKLEAEVWHMVSNLFSTGIPSDSEYCFPIILTTASTQS